MLAPSTGRLAIGAHVRAALPLAVSIALAVALTPARLARDPGPGGLSAGERPQRRHVSGALRALELWARARAYPDPVISGGRHAAAFAQAQALPEPSRPPRDSSAKAAPGYRERWRPLGPANVGGRTLAIALNPQNPRTVWAGSAGGGLWRSPTGGRGASAWEYVSTGYPVMAVSSIAFAPADSNVLYVGTGEVYGYQSAVGGVHVRVTRGSYGIGVLKSADGGRTWRPSLDWSRAQQRGVQALRVDPQRPQRVWAATTEGVYRSEDAGGSWTRVLDVVMAMDLEVHPTGGDTVYAACGNFHSPGRGVYRTHDGGATWVRVANGWPADFGGMIRLALAPSDPRTVYASVGDGYEDNSGSWLLRSRDGGDTWEVRTTTAYSTYQGWYSHDVVVDPTNADHVLFCGISIWKSDTGGTTPRRISNPGTGYDGVIQPGAPEGAPDYSHADHHALVVHPTDPRIVYIANDGGIFRTTDGGVTFEACNGGYQTSQFYNGFTCSNTDSVPAIGGLQDNGSVIYEGTAAWRRVVGGDGGWTAVEPGNSQVIYATTQYLNIYRSGDGGRTFITIAPQLRSEEDAAFIAPVIISPATAATLYAGGVTVFRSVDRGSHWTEGGTINGQPALCLVGSTRRAGTLYAGVVPDAAGRTIFRSTDAGKTWREVGVGLPNRYPMDLAIDPGNDQVLIVTFGGFGSPHVYRTDDAGLSWQDIGAGLPDVPTGAVAFDPRPPGTVYVGNDVGVFASQDNGATWFHLRDGLPDAVICTDLSIQSMHRKLRVATHGNGVYERSLLSGATNLPPSRVVVLSQNHPNPFNPSTTIAFTLQRIARVDLRVYDARGRLVRTLLAGDVRLPGDHQVTWDGTDEGGRNVASGAYLYCIEAGGEAHTVAMTLLR